MLTQQHSQTFTTKCNLTSPSPLLCVFSTLPPHVDFSSACFLKREESVSAYELRHGGGETDLESDKGQVDEQSSWRSWLSI